MSRLALGTVQFGINYGIANVSGMPDEESSHSILNAALNMGICDFDTAKAYGKSELVLGSWHRKHEARIVSKYSSCSDQKSIISDRLNLAINDTLKSIDCSQLYGYLLHNEEAIFDAAWLSGLASLKESGLVRKVGVSVYEISCAIFAANSPAIDIIQIPYSMMDQRLDACGFFELAEANGKEIWARSALVQGLLLLAEDKIPTDLKGMIPLRELARKIGAHFGFSLQQMAVLFSLGNHRIDKVLIGVDTLEQLLEYKGIEAQIDSFQDCRDMLVRELRGRLDPYLVSPHKWKR